MLAADPFEVYSVVNGTIRLDGGAMFGVVPKVLWQGVTTPDASNRIPLATRTLIAVDRARKLVVLVDTGCGSKWAADQAERYAVRYDGSAIPEALRKLKFTENDVTDVVVTHLHFDHNGGLTRWRDEKRKQTDLCFPRARHWIHRLQWEHAHGSNYRDRASFFPDDFAGLAEAGVLRFVDGEQPAPPFEGLEWFLSHGHTPYQLHPIFGRGRQRVLFVGDMVPTIAHLRLAWGMAYDLHPLTTIAEKEAVYRR